MSEPLELQRATPEKGSLADYHGDPNYNESHRFAPGNKLAQGLHRGRQKVAAAIFNRALEVMMGAEPLPEDDKNPLVHLINDTCDTTLDRDLRQKAAIAACKFVIGTRSNVNLDLPEGEDGDVSAGTRRMQIALGLLRETHG